MHDIIQKFIHDSIDELNDVFAPPNPLGKDSETVLYGDGGSLDSLGFVNFVSILEEKFESEMGLSVSLADDVEAGGESDPLRTIGTLTDHLKSLVDA